MVPLMSHASTSSRPLLRLALIGALALSFGLSACGRKGGLDPPPAASAAGAAPAATAAPAADAAAQPNGAIPPRKHIPLDVLLN